MTKSEVLLKYGHVCRCDFSEQKELDEHQRKMGILFMHLAEATEDEVQEAAPSLNTIRKNKKVEK